MSLVPLAKESQCQCKRTTNFRVLHLVIVLLCFNFSHGELMKASVSKHLSSLRGMFTSAATSCSLLCALPLPSEAGMLIFPLPSPLKNNIVFVRAGECFADSRHEIQTNPVKKLRQDNALTARGQEQAIQAAQKLVNMDFSPTYIWTSNTERAYETAAIIARECQLGQNRIVPEYSFLDARSMGVFEGKNAEQVSKLVHDADAREGVNYKPPANNDGTPSESVSDVLVRGNQLVSTIESMYSGENVVIVSPDSDNLSVLYAALHDEKPDASLPNHARFSFNNGELRRVEPVVKASTLLVTGQTQEEADVTNRKIRALRVAGTAKVQRSNQPNSWVDLWHSMVDTQAMN